MTGTARSRRRWRPFVALALGVGVVATGTAVANADTTPPPPLSLVTTATEVTLTRYVYEFGSFFLDPNTGVYLIAGKDPFEIEVKRKSYADPIVAQQVTTRNGRKTKVPLPAGMVTDFGGLKDFTTLTMTDANGTDVVSGSQDFCPNTYETARARPDAPDTTPYPADCFNGNPFQLGNVWGIQSGWTAAIAPRELEDLPDGTYQASIDIAQKYRDHFKITGAGTNLTITIESIYEGALSTAERARGEAKVKAAQAAKAAQDAQPAAAGAAAGAGHDHAHLTEGDATQQASAYSPDLRPAARRPETARSSAALPKGPRPDLRSLPAWGIGLVDGADLGDVPGRKYIVFGATVWNAGTSPLVVDGFRRTGTDLMDAYQYFYDAKGKQVGSTNAGTMEWDKREGHLHWHFTDFAQYSLLTADKKEAVRSGKEAFCLVNTDAVDYTIPNAKVRPSNTDLSSSCGANTAVAVREVLDIGNGDTYTQFLPGQSFDVTDLPNGTYYIEVKANPSDRLAELSTTNNTSLREVILSGSGDDRKLLVPAVHGLDGPTG
ncbi:lysyl oxidase family protein [Actinoplanes sp. NPDC023714]|uniref:lysyl oxidase family protein n=1 Tax=Actinoplanes sp. NPDC023714 TaxID=3154322 RepID=UPI0033C468EF